jgi:hypothetical protein
VSDGVSTPRAPLSVAADLTLSVDGTEATVRSTGERLFVEVPSVVSAVELLNGLSVTELRHLHELLTTTGLALEVRTHQRTVAVLGVCARPGMLSRQLGVFPLELRFWGAVSALGAGVARTVERFR